VREADDDTQLGRVMAAVVSLELGVNGLRSAWDVRNVEHNTAMSEVTELRRCVETLSDDMKGLLEAQGKTSKQISTATKLAPAAIAAIEIGRMVFAHYFGGV